MKKDADFWKKDFERFAHDILEINTRPEVEPLFPDFRKEIPADHWLDLSVNPIVSIKSAYPAREYFPEYSDGAEIALLDGTIYRWDGMLGNGGWNIREHGKIIELPFRLEQARRLCFESNESAEACVKHVHSNQNEAVKLWEKSDDSMKRGAANALAFFVWWMKED